MDQYSPTGELFPSDPFKNNNLTPQAMGSTFPVEGHMIEWDRLVASRAMLLDTNQDMPEYLLKPEVLQILKAEHDSMHRLILDLMWTTGGRISEILALTQENFVVNRYGWHLRLKTLKQKPGRPSKRALERGAQRYVPITDEVLIDRIKVYVRSHTTRKTERLFKVSRQTVGRRLKKLAIEAGIHDVNVHPHTLRHSFAIHLLLHGRPLKYIGQLLGHKRIETTEIYTNVLTSDGGHFMQGVEFH